MIKETSQNNKRIAKNTLLLYIRMFITMTVSLYTSRVVLGALGVEDFGIYNVVGGFVAMFTIISGALTSSITRYLTFELGKNQTTRLNNVFSASLFIQISLGVSIILLGELFGWWFITEKMTIPDNRVVAAVVVLQFSLINFFVNLISIPYNAVIIAHERMNTFAFVGVFEVLLKLVCVILLSYSPYDRLILWGGGLFLISLIIRFIYGYYCSKHFSECHLKKHIDFSIIKEMIGFASWNFIGTLASVLRTQGVNLLLNIYFNPAINAARAIAVQINTAVYGFASNFMTAVNPQITKLYSQDRIKESFNLCRKSSRLSFFLLFAISFPLIVDMPLVLKLWLGKYPVETIVFARLTLILAMIESISIPFMTLQLATGKIKMYQIVVGGLNLAVFPVSWSALELEYNNDIVYYVAIVFALVAASVRLIMLNKIVKINIISVFKEWTFKILPVIIISVVLYYTIITYVVSNVFLNMLIVLILCIFLIWIIGLNVDERNSLIKIVKNKIQR